MPRQSTSHVIGVASLRWSKSLNSFRFRCSCLVRKRWTGRRGAHTANSGLRRASSMTGSESAAEMSDEKRLGQVLQPGGAAWGVEDALGSGGSANLGAAGLAVIWPRSAAAFAAMAMAMEAERGRRGGGVGVTRRPAIFLLKGGLRNCVSGSGCPDSGSRCLTKADIFLD